MEEAALVFGVNGLIYRIPMSNVDPTARLAGYLRENLGLFGTKVGCGEGGCGACAVLLSRWDPLVGRVATISANSCIRHLSSLHGCHVTTIEGIGGPGHKNGVHPIQKRFQQLNASQCGYCTPGFVVSTYAQLAQKKESTMHDIEDALDGNLCRCTGYRPIIDAAKSFAADSNIVDYLGAKAGAEPAALCNEHLNVTAEIEAMFPALLKDTAALRKLWDGVSGLVLFQGGGKTMVMARSTEDVASALRTYPTARICCAQTSVGVYKGDLTSAPVVIDVSSVPTLCDASFDTFGLTVGAATSFSSFIRLAEENADRVESNGLADVAGGGAACWGSAAVRVLRALAGFARCIGNIHVRHVASIGGNLMMAKQKGFPSDLATALCTLGTNVTLIEFRSCSTAPLVRDVLLYDFIQRPDAPGDTSLILSITVPMPTKEDEATPEATKPDSAEALDCKKEGLMGGIVAQFYRTAIRSADGHAILNAGFLAKVDSSGTIVSLRAVYGCTGECDVAGHNAPKICDAVVSAVQGRKLGKSVLREFTAAFVCPTDFITGEHRREHRRRLVKAFAMKFLEDARQVFLSGWKLLKQQASTVFGDDDGTIAEADSGNLLIASPDARLLPSRFTAMQIVPPLLPLTAGDDKLCAPVGEAIPRPEGIAHATGTAVFPSDHPEPMNMLHATWVLSPIAKGRIVSIPKEAALRLPGVAAVITAKDLPSWCNNTVRHPLGLPAGGWPLLPVADVRHAGTGVALVLADTKGHAIVASRVLGRACKYEAETPIVTTRQAIAAGKEPVITTPIPVPLPLPPPSPSQERTAAGPNSAAPAPDASARTGREHATTHTEHHHQDPHENPPGLLTMNVVTRLNTQKHFYMETHAVYAECDADGAGIVVTAGTQFPEYAQSAVASALGLRSNDVRLVQIRMGGSFGAKVEADHVVAASVAAKLLQRPVKLHLDRTTDLLMQGGREELEAHSKVAFLRSGAIQQVDVHITRNFGWMVNLSIFGNLSLQATLPGVYRVPSFSGVVKGYLTDTQNRCPTRAPGKIESAVVMEEIMDRIAAELGLHSQAVREANFMTPTEAAAKTQMPAEEWTLPTLYGKLMEERGWRQRIGEASAFNAVHRTKKKGVAAVPFKYNIGVLHATARVVVYADGSVLVHHSGVEMGQGLVVKVLQAVAAGLSTTAAGPVPLDAIRAAGNDSGVLPKQMITGGSVGSEATVMAAYRAAVEVAARLAPIAEALPAEKRTWPATAAAADAQLIDLTATGMYAGRAYDSNPDAVDRLQYYCLCVAGAEIELDVLTGTVTVSRVDIIYDAARSLNPAVDVGQIEGAFMMGLGYLLTEEMVVDEKTGMVAPGYDGTWNYKIPCVKDVPREFNVELLCSEPFKRGILSSKASAEPPLCVAPALTSAIRQAVQSVRKDGGLGGFVPITSPYTADKIVAACGPIALRL